KEPGCSPSLGRSARLPREQGGPRGVLCNGRRHTVAKRYSEFQALHKRIKKTCKVPDFPPRRVPNWMPKVLEQRRQGLELYMRGVLYHNEELPQEVLDFLKVRHFQQEPKAGIADLLPDTVLSGVLQGLYVPESCSSPPHAAATSLLPLRVGLLCSGTSSLTGWVSWALGRDGVVGPGPTSQARNSSCKACGAVGGQACWEGSQQ
uniref:Sorting nexin 22 n=1 Tax=Dromaius novaehollandiae TaxID=8790 RepID=A0A8C4KNS4_DRONO